MAKYPESSHFAISSLQGQFTGSLWRTLSCKVYLCLIQGEKYKSVPIPCLLFLRHFLHGVVYVGQPIKLELQDLEFHAHCLFPQTSCGVIHFPSMLHFKTDQMVITI